MDLPPITKSLRFRVSWITSAVAFGIGGLALGVVYLAVLDTVRGLTMTRQVVTGGHTIEIDGTTLLLPQIEEQQVRTLESLVREFILNQVAGITLLVVAALFILSLVVGWFVAGRALQPLTRITAVAEEIEATDLTRRIGLAGPHDELTRMAATFDAMLDRLDRAFRAQRELLAKTSHDLRTPLAVIRSNVEVILEDPDATVDDWRETGQLVSRASDQMGRMVEELLAVARLEVGEVVMVGLDLANLARDVVGAWAARVEAAGVSLEVDAQSAVIEGDRAALERAVGNLVENALRMSPSGSSIGIGTGHVGPWAYFAVADRGPGIDPAVVVGSADGRGLGLPIVREVARLHHGRLTSDDRSDGGAVLILWIPTEGAGMPTPLIDALPPVYRS
ncbi:MAG TPA: HAMP domain-containing sensor histidine kinase [Acidimicrobiia bacterium]|nr:HAMP domain-containing sensor histidine kinase [Acidimicrobiia bacterium]